MSPSKLFRLSLLVVAVFAAAVVVALPVQEMENNQELCGKNTPCGWAIYSPFVRNIEYFMKNICVCPPEHKCLMATDDLSAKAYVYQCSPA